LKLRRGADEIGVPYNTLRDAHFRGDLPVVRVGRAWFVDQADLRAFIERNKVSA
jgi:hypothetical protein